jgi:DNA modification methylase
MDKAMNDGKIVRWTGTHHTKKWALYCGDSATVLDLFLGSGTTMRVSLQKDKNVIGIDLNPDFCNYILRELQENKE